MFTGLCHWQHGPAGRGAASPSPLALAPAAAAAAFPASVAHCADQMAHYLAVKVKSVSLTNDYLQIAKFKSAKRQLAAACGWVVRRSAAALWELTGGRCKLETASNRSISA